MTAPTLKSLQRRWQKATGETMPDAIARLDLADVERATKLTEQGVHVFLPREPVVVEYRDGFGCGESMREWDCDSQY